LNVSKDEKNNSVIMDFYHDSHESEGSIENDNSDDIFGDNQQLLLSMENRSSLWSATSDEEQVDDQLSSVEIMSDEDYLEKQWEENVSWLKMYYKSNNKLLQQIF